MTASCTPDTIRNIGRHAGILPPREIAERLGFSLSFVERVAREHGFNLRIRPKAPDTTSQLSAAGNVPLRRAIRRDLHFSVNLRAADAKILREKAAQRMTNPSRLLAEVFEGALARGKIDDMASAAGHYHPNGADDLE